MEAAAQGGAQLGMNDARREKNWDELTDSEKVERMRDVVKRQGRHINRLDHIITALQRHQHSVTGDVLVHHLDNRAMGESNGSRIGGGEYF
jgi:hypothetical protein